MTILSFSSYNLLGLQAFHSEIWSPFMDERHPLPPSFRADLVAISRWSPPLVNVVFSCCVGMALAAEGRHIHILWIGAQIEQ